MPSRICAHEISDSLTFKAVAGLIDASQTRLFDNDLIGNLDVLKRTNDYEGDSWSIEARLESESESVDWVIGALYAEDQQEQFNDVAVSSDPTATFNGVGFLPPFPEGLGLARNTKNFEVESLAVFADATWHVTDSLDLIAGARYTQDDVLNERTSFGIAPTCNCGPPDPGFFPSFVNFDASAGERRYLLRRRFPTRRYPLRMERRGQRVRDDLEGLQGRWHEHRQQHQRRRIAAFNVPIRRGNALELRDRHQDRVRRPACASERIGLLHGLGGPAGRGIPLPDAR